MIVREVRLILLLLALGAVATFGITAAYTNLTGILRNVIPLLIVIALILVAIGSLELLVVKREVRFVAASSENVIAARPIAAAGLAAILASGVLVPPTYVQQIDSDTNVILGVPSGAGTNAVNSALNG